MTGLKCFGCGGQVIWGGDHDCEDDEDYFIVSNLHCMDCGIFYLMYHPTPPSDQPNDSLDSGSV